MSYLCAVCEREVPDNHIHNFFNEKEEKMLPVKYSEIRNELKSGDMILFSGGGFVSRMIQMFTRSQWSHVGLVIKDDWWDMLLLWESTTLSKIKTVHGNIRQGVAIRPLSEVIENYDGQVGVRQLTFPLTDAQELTIGELRQEFKGRDYEQNKSELFKSAYDFIGGRNEEDLSSLFCSELVAEAYQRVNFLDEVKPSNEYTPADLAELSLDIRWNRFSDIIKITRG